MLLQVSDCGLGEIFSEAAFKVVYLDQPDLFFRLGLYREAEKQFRSALNQQEVVDTYLYLAKVTVAIY